MPTEKNTKTVILLLIVSIVLSLVAIAMFLKYQDKADKYEDHARPMLNRRGFNQEHMLIADWDKFSIEVKTEILDNWEIAEYSKEGKQYLLSITPEYKTK